MYDGTIWTNLVEVGPSLANIGQTVGKPVRGNPFEIASMFGLHKTEMSEQI